MSQEWISVDDRLPENLADGAPQLVLVKNKAGHVYTVYHDSEYKGFGQSKPTDWMPLPDPETGYRLTQQELNAIKAQAIDDAACIIIDAPHCGAAYDWLQEQATKLRENKN